NSKRSAKPYGGAASRNAAEPLRIRRFAELSWLTRRHGGLRKRHQHDRHRNAADLALDIQQGPAADPEPGGRRPARLRPHADPFAAWLAEQLHRKIGIGIGYHI